MIFPTTTSSSIFAVLPMILGGASARPTAAAAAAAAADKPAAFFLAGDSTTAVQSSGGGGWGSGFLNTTLQGGATGTNYGHNGATTVSFREGGDWDTVLQAVKDAVDDYTPYVTIQVGECCSRKALVFCGALLMKRRAREQRTVRAQ